MYLYRLLVLIAVITLSACQTYIPNLSVNPSFTYQTMAQGGMMIAGVSSYLETFGSRQSDRYAGEMVKAIKDEHPELRLIDAVNLRTRMASKLYNSMMDEWTDGLYISKDSMTALKTAIPNTRYASFARIEQTNTRVSDTKRPFYQRIKKKKVQTGVSHTLKAIRDMKVTYIVYDLNSGIEVWNGVVPVSKTERKYQLHKFGSGRYTLKFPEFPTVRATFMTASKAFAENLPKKE